jgi:hypothetical protein
LSKSPIGATGRERLGQPHLLRNLLEAALPVVEVEAREVRLEGEAERGRGQVRGGGAERVHLDVQVAVVVEVEEPAREAAQRLDDSQLRRHVLEGPVAVVAIQAVVLPEVRDVDVRVSVRVVVAGGQATGEAIVRDARGLRHVGERAVAVVAEELAGSIDGLVRLVAA